VCVLLFTVSFLLVVLWLGFLVVFFVFFRVFWFCRIGRLKLNFGFVFLLLMEEINELLGRLHFSEEESVQVVSTTKVDRMQSCESWAVGKIMAKESPNKEVMYRVFKSLWFTKEEVEFVALKEGVIIVKFGCLKDRSRILNLTPWLFDRCLFAMLPFEKGKEMDSYEFRLAPFWVRIYNIPIELMDRQIALDVGNAIGVLVAIDWKDRWMRAPIVTPNQGRGMRRNGVEVFKPMTQSDENKEDN
ncbi:hypothetical protein Gohar_027495, partial [Gossypium harknessii]|nr:hypothetical protein [Gossypium harknessii]